MNGSWREWGFFLRWNERRELRLRIAEELRFHREEAIAANLARGLSPKEARTEAESRLGNSHAIVHECAGVAAEDQPSDALSRRRLHRYALIAVAAVAPPALLFLLLSHHVRKLPVVHPDTLSVSINAEPFAFGIAEQAPEQAAAFRRAGGTLLTPQGEIAAAGFVVSQGFFQLQGVQPAMGAFTTEAPCIVLSHRLWSNRYNTDRGIIGRTVLFAGARREVCAVMPPDYWFIQRSRLFWLLEDRAADGDAEAYLLLRTVAAANALDLPQTIPLSVVSRGALTAASAVFAAALLLLAALGAMSTVSLARTLGGWRSSWLLLVRGYVFLFAKAVPILAVLAILWTFAIESPAFAPVGYFAGVSSLVSVYLFTLLSVAAVWYALVDQRARCPVCQRALGMPVGLGVPGSILFDMPAVEYVCTYGHGTLYLPEPTSEGVCEPAWREPATWWNDLIGSSASSSGSPG